MSVRSHLELRQADHDEMAKAIADFEARGGKVQQLPIGLMVDLDANYNRKAAQAKAARVAPTPVQEDAPLRVPNAETFPQPSPPGKAKRSNGRPERLAAIAEAAAAAVPSAPTVPASRDARLSAWKRIQAAFSETGNRWLYSGELRLITGIDGRNVISTALCLHADELERMGKRPYCQFRLRNP